MSSCDRRRRIPSPAETAAACERSREQRHGWFCFDATRVSIASLAGPANDAGTETRGFRAQISSGVALHYQPLLLAMAVGANSAFLLCMQLLNVLSAEKTINLLPGADSFEGGDFS